MVEFKYNDRKQEFLLYFIHGLLNISLCLGMKDLDLDYIYTLIPISKGYIIPKTQNHKSKTKHNFKNRLLGFLNFHRHCK